MKYTAETVYYQYYALFEMKQTSLFESPNFKPRGRDGIVCLALIFSFYSHVVIQRLLYSNYSLVHQGSMAPLLFFPHCIYCVSQRHC